MENVAHLDAMATVGNQGNPLPAACLHHPANLSLQVDLTETQALC